MSDVNVWSVKPEYEMINLTYTTPDGEARPFWIKVKKYLNIGEKRKVSTAGWRSMSSGKRPNDEEAAAEIQIDWKAQTFARTEVYLVDWSLSNEGVPLTRDGIETLDEDVYTIIENAITEHIAEMERQKKAKSGKSMP